MSDHQVFTSRLKGRPLLDSEGLTIGRIRDVVILPGAAKEPPRALGLVVTLQRRRIFVNLGQIAEISVDGAHLKGGSVDLDRFTRRTGEILASELYGQHVTDGSVVDVAICPSEQQRIGWEVCALAVSRGRSLLHRGPEIVSWDQYPELFKTDPLTEQLAELRELQPADLATAVEGLPPSRRDQIAAALDDEQLADLLEEMPEQDQVRLLASLGLERSADVVEEMQPDDAADLLEEMSPEQRERLLTAMECGPGRGPAAAAAVQPDHGGRADDLRASHRHPGHAGRRGAGPDQGPRHADHRGRAGVRVRAADGDADRPLPRHRGVPAAAAPGPVRPGRASASRRASSSGRTCPNATWRPGSRPTTWSAWRYATRTATWSAR